MKDQSGDHRRFRAREVIVIAALGAIAGALVSLSVTFKDWKLAPVRAAFEEKFQQVRVGDTKESVRALLGDPTRIWPGIRPPAQRQRTPVDATTGATLGYREMWDYDVAARTYVVTFGPSPRWHGEIRVVGKHPDMAREFLTTGSTRRE